MTIPLNRNLTHMYTYTHTRLLIERDGHIPLLVAAAAAAATPRVAPVAAAAPSRERGAEPSRYVCIIYGVV